jgi:hypothetical protein
MGTKSAWSGLEQPQAGPKGEPLDGANQPANRARLESGLVSKIYG